METKIILMLAFIVLITLPFAVERIIQQTVTKELKHRAILRTAWESARMNRLTWLATNQDNYDPEQYEKMWEYELGAEAIINVCYPHSSRTSWVEYCAYRQKIKP